MTQTDYEQLEQLLQAAGRSEPSVPEPHTDLVQKVYLRSHRKKQSRRTAMGTLSICCLLAFAGWLWQSQPWQSQTKETPHSSEQIATSTPAAKPAPETVPDDVSEMRAEFARLEKEIEQTLLIAQKALRLQQINADLLRQRRKAPSYTLEMARAEFEKTAFLLVDRGDQLGRQPDGRQAQIDIYRQAVEMFSETSWAQTAQERLANLENNQ